MGGRPKSHVFYVHRRSLAVPRHKCLCVCTFCVLGTGQDARLTGRNTSAMIWQRGITKASPRFLAPRRPCRDRLLSSHRQERRACVTMEQRDYTHGPFYDICPCGVFLPKWSPRSTHACCVSRQNKDLSFGAKGPKIQGEEGSQDLPVEKANHPLRLPRHWK